MQFNSFAFFGFFAVVFALYWALGQRWRTLLLFAAGLGFYAAFGPAYLLLLLALSAFAWGAGLWLGKAPGKARLAAAVLVSLAPLLLFKYYNFLMDAFAGAASLMGAAFAPLYVRWAQPVGISYYTFQMVSYLVDIYRGRQKPERNFLVCSLTFGLFLQIVAGPLTRPRDLGPCIRREKVFDSRRAIAAAQLILFGLFKKVAVSDALNYYTDAVFSDPQKLHGFSLVIIAFFYAVQIYADFSGYTDMARGFGGLLGLELAENFRSPYLSRSVREFWGRWHMSLSSWLKEYVYIPLGGSRVSRPRHYCNLFVTFVVSGLWHGASVPMLLWGMLHGLYTVAGAATRGARERLCERLRIRRQAFLPSVVSSSVTFLLVTFAWIFFASPNADNAFYIVTHLFYDFVPSISYLKESVVLLGLSMEACVRFAVLFLALFWIDVQTRDTGYTAWLSRRRPWFQAVLCYAWMAGIVFWGSIGGGSFMYFQF